MKLDAIIADVRAVWEAQTSIADTKLRLLLLRSGINAFAALIAAFGLLMAELAAYFTLVQIWSAVMAAAVLSAVNFTLAVIVSFLAIRLRHARELALLNELHSSAVERLSSHVREIRGDLTGTHALEALFPILIVPLAVALKGMLKRQRRQS